MVIMRISSGIVMTNGVEVMRGGVKLVSSKVSEPHEFGASH